MTMLTHELLSSYINTLKKTEIVKKATTKSGFVDYYMLIPFTKHLSETNKPYEALHEFDQVAETIYRIYISMGKSHQKDTSNTKYVAPDLRSVDVYCCLIHAFIHRVISLDELKQRAQQCGDIKSDGYINIYNILKPYIDNFRKEITIDNIADYVSIIHPKCFYKIQKSDAHLPTYRSPFSIFWFLKSSDINKNHSWLFNLLYLFSEQNDTYVKNICYLEMNKDSKIYLYHTQNKTFHKMVKKFLNLDVHQTFTEEDVNWYHNAKSLWQHTPGCLYTAYLDECKSKQDVMDFLEEVSYYCTKNHFKYANYIPYIEFPKGETCVLTVSDLKRANVEYKISSIVI